MGSSSINEQNNILLLDEDNILLSYDLTNNKSDSEEEQNIDDIKNVFEEKKMKSNLSSIETVKVPVTFEWDNGGNNVYLTGEFCNWKQFFLMKKEENGKFILNLSLPKGKYQYKFKVDEIWKFNDKFPTINDNGIINNIIDTSKFEMNNENIEGKATRANTTNNEENERTKSKKYLCKSKNNSSIRLKNYSNYIPKKDEYLGKVDKMTFKSKSCLNFSEKKIGNDKFMNVHEKNILSDNISYKKIDIVPNTDIGHINIKNILNKNKRQFISSVPVRYRQKYTTFVYYKP